jgi:hypothetical protein
LGEKRVPSKIYANSNLCNLTHITQEPSYVYTFFTYTLKEITALVVTDNDVSSSSSILSSSSSKQQHNKSTNETAQAVSICMQTQNDSSNNPAPPELKCCD